MSTLTIKVSKTSGDRAEWKLVSAGTRVKAPAPPKGLQLQNGFTAIKAEAVSDATTSKRPGPLSLKSCKTTRKKWQVIVKSRSMLRGDRGVCLSTRPNIWRALLLAMGQDPGCCGGVPKGGAGPLTTTPCCYSMWAQMILTGKTWKISKVSTEL